MNTPTPKISPLRQRMIEDMRIRKLEAKTQSGYIRAVRHFTIWFGRSPDQATAEDLHLPEPSASVQIPIAPRHC
jgi:hypothetical protein